MATQKLNLTRDQLATFLKNQEQIKQFIDEKVNALIAHEDLPDDQLPECSADERWAKPDTFRVMKPGNKKASKVEKSLAEAQAWQMGQKNPAEFEIINRPGEWTRCEFYCPVRNFCHQFKKYAETRSKDDE